MPDKIFLTYPIFPLIQSDLTDLMKFSQFGPLRSLICGGSLTLKTPH